MAERTHSSETMTRSELATYLSALAAEFEADDDEIAVEVGNKSVTLHPPENVECDVEVVERSSVLRGSRETVDIELSWKP
ncbi:amphi-Trp domain-containing protein [Natrialbaceae archaeon AArc-T1-2]|uniref:amphi-Trp domain-containing protein n=1 Tax=Natrialbaceae archaeon AArc-T1-2 TaxID=3053904 RepID=UPI00255A8C79|nr:amphi-Trp domain-containing protein [Natrialbaceae archaeon AArc-T1-2]WIV68114.1 amphi-Trp domain-containing protein [Natrialbaceae archaeon AArc-T1-2]